MRSLLLVVSFPPSISQRLSLSSFIPFSPSLPLCKVLEHQTTRDISQMEGLVVAVLLLKNLMNSRMAPREGTQSQRTMQMEQIETQFEIIQCSSHVYLTCYWVFARVLLAFSVEFSQFSIGRSSSHKALGRPLHVVFRLGR